MLCLSYNFLNGLYKILNAIIRECIRKPLVIPRVHCMFRKRSYLNSCPKMYVEQGRVMRGCVQQGVATLTAQTQQLDQATNLGTTDSNMTPNKAALFRTQSKHEGREHATPVPENDWHTFSKASGIQQGSNCHECYCATLIVL